MAGVAFWLHRDEDITFRHWALNEDRKGVSVGLYRNEPVFPASGVFYKRAELSLLKPLLLQTHFVSHADLF